MRKMIDMEEAWQRQARLMRPWEKWGSIKKFGICIICGRFTHHRVAQDEPLQCVHCGQEGTLVWIQLTNCRKCLQKGNQNLKSSAKD